MLEYNFYRPNGPPQGPPHGPPQGPPHGPPQGPPHGPPHGPPQGPPHGPPHGPPQGPPQGPPHGPPHGPPQGPPHGPPQGPPQGPPHLPPYTHGHHNFGQNAPNMRPPNFIPRRPVFQPGPFRLCVNTFAYIWFYDGRDFWAWVSYISNRTIYGYRWNGFMWLYFEAYIYEIDTFFCITEL